MRVNSVIVTSSIWKR